MKLKIQAFLICTMPALASASSYDSLIEKHSRLVGLDPNLVKAVITRESNFNPNARSPKDARGLMQVIPSTAKLMGVNPSRLYEPEQSIIAGTRYLSFLNERYNGNLIKIIAGYNAGHGAVDKYKGIPPYRETQNYVRYVSAKYKTLGGIPQNNIDRFDSQPQTKKRQDILVLASWQKSQYQQPEAQETTSDYQYDDEPVKLRTVNQQPVNQQSVNQSTSKSFVQTLNKGEYTSVF